MIPNDQSRSGHRFTGRSAFTLVELLVVIAVITVLLVLIVPAVSQIGAKKTEQAFYDIAGAVDTAHAYAMANNTYVYLGFVEYDASKSPGGTQTAGMGRVVVAAIASRDGTRGYADTSSANAATSWQSGYAKGANFVSVIPPTVFESTHLAALASPPTSGAMLRPDPGNDAWRVGSDSFKQDCQLSFSLPLGSDLTGGKYNFNQVLLFAPNGSVGVQTSYSDLGQTFPVCMEIGIQPTIGNAQPGATATSNYAAVTINGTTGAQRIYRP